MLVILNKGQTTIWEEIEIYSQEKSIYNGETISRQEHRISKYRIKIYNDSIGFRYYGSK